MKIYVSHSRSFDFEKELYEPIMQIEQSIDHEFILPHEKGRKFFDSKTYLKEEADLVIAEISYPAIGVGIELGWANIFKVPIVCFFKRGVTPSNSVKVLTDLIFEYSDKNDFSDKLAKFLENSD